MLSIFDFFFSSHPSSSSNANWYFPVAIIHRGGVRLLPRDVRAQIEVAITTTSSSRLYALGSRVEERLRTWPLCKWWCPTPQLLAETEDKAHLLSASSFYVFSSVSSLQGVT